MRHKAYLIDVTNRDGVQTSRILLPKLSKTMLNLYLDEMGFYQSEMGFPTLKHEMNYINANLGLVKLGAIKRLHLEGWCRAVPEDIELAFRNCPEIKHLNISMSTSDIMIQGKFQGRKTWKDIIDSLVKSVRLAKELGVETLGVNAEDASRTELSKLIEFVLAGKEAGADRFRYCDTLGVDDPITIYETIKALALATKFPIEMHCHNDLGMAEAVSVAGASRNSLRQEGSSPPVNTAGLRASGMCTTSWGSISALTVMRGRSWNWSSTRTSIPRNRLPTTNSGSLRVIRTLSERSLR